MVGSLPDSLPGMQAQQVLKDNFEVDNTYLVMYDSAMDSDDKSRMVAEIDKLDGVESTLGLRSFHSGKYDPCGRAGNPAERGL